MYLRMGVWQISRRIVASELDVRERDGIGKREGYGDPLDSSVKRESIENSCKSCVACTDLAIFSATNRQG